MAVFVRLAAAEMAAVQIAWVRCTGSVLLLLAATRGRGLRPRAENRLAVAARGILGVASLTLYYVGVAWAGAGLATLLHSTYPVWTALWVARRSGRPVTGPIAAALALNVTGALVALGPDISLGSTLGLGGLVSLVSGVMSAGAVATAAELRQSESTALVTTWFMGTGAVLLLPPAVAIGLPPLTPALLGVLALVVLSSVAGQLLLHHGLGFVSATVAALATATSILTAAAGEAAVYGAPIPARVLVAAVLMLGAVWLVGRAQPSEAE
jgi:drug/metabolite transporter (DMT)-like permease